jgi:hypothetical protein
MTLNRKNYCPSVQCISCAALGQSFRARRSFPLIAAFEGVCQAVG